jgi:cytochrome c
MSVSDLSGKIFGSLILAVGVSIVCYNASTQLVHPANVGDSAYPLSETLAPPLAASASAPSAAGGAAKAAASDVPAPLTADQLAKADPDRGQKIAQKCMVCHSFPKGAAARVGPNLWGIIDNKRAHMAGFNYSDAVAHLGGTWTVQNIARFIFKPKAFIPGTKMGFGGLPDPQARADVLAFLNKESDAPVDLVKDGAK